MSDGWLEAQKMKKKKSLTMEFWLENQWEREGRTKAWKSSPGEMRDEDVQTMTVEGHWRQGGKEQVTWAVLGVKKKEQHRTRSQWGSEN